MPVLNGKPFYAADMVPIMVRRLAHRQLQTLSRKYNLALPVLIEALIKEHNDNVPIPKPDPRRRGKGLKTRLTHLEKLSP